MVWIALVLLALAFALVAAPVWIVVLLYGMRRRLDQLEGERRGGVPVRQLAPAPAPNAGFDRKMDDRESGTLSLASSA